MIEGKCNTENAHSHGSNERTLAACRARKS